MIQKNGESKKKKKKSLSLAKIYKPLKVVNQKSTI